MQGGAGAQQAPAAAAAPPQPPVQAWATQCSSAGRTDPQNCSIEQKIVVRETGQQIARLAIQTGASEPRQPALLIHLPLALSIRAGVMLKIDDAEGIKFDIQTCDNGGCYSGSPVSPVLLTLLKKGHNLKILFQDLQQQELSVPFSLAGFSAAYAKVE